MGIPERRQVERVVPERLAFITINPDNGGIVLNVSPAGLCFQSVAPVQSQQPITFSFDHERATDASGEVVWTDDTHKVAGLRFKDLPAETRDQIDRLLDGEDNNTEEFPSQTPESLEEPGLPTRVPPPVVTPQSRSKYSHLVDSSDLGSDGERVKDDSFRVVVVPWFQRRWVRVAENLGTGLITFSILCGTVASIAVLRNVVHSSRSEQQATSTDEIPTKMAALPRPGTSAVRLVSHASAGSYNQGLHAGTAAKTSSHHGDDMIAPDTVVSLRQTSVKTPTLIAMPVQYQYPKVPDPVVSGDVSLRLLISATGLVQGVKVMNGNPILADASVRTVRRWRYRPLELKGHAVESEANVTISFKGDDAVTINFQR